MINAAPAVAGTDVSRSYRLRATEPTIEPWECVLPLGAVHLGSGVSNRVRLDHDGVSRRHAMLIVGKESLALVDLDSKNGTFVNGQQVSRAEVFAGDLLSFGPYCLTVEQLDSEEVALAVAVREDSSVVAWSEAGTTTPARCQRFGGRPPIFDLVTELGEALGPAGELAPALAYLQEALQAEAVLALDLDSAMPSVLSTAGDPTPQAVRIMAVAWNAASRRRSTPARWTWSGCSGFETQRSAAAVSTSSGRARGLLLSSQNELDPELLGCLLSVLELRWPSESSTAATAVARRPKLELPEGSVRCPSPLMIEVYRQVVSLADSDLPVLIVGETGAGKEYLAECLHRSSSRGVGPFVAINCAAIPADLLEAELFGIGEGVATGVAGRQGRFLDAEGGTLFLDEIGEMTAALQAKLLRALQERTVYPLGSPSGPFDARVVAATNVDIYRRMESGRFRQDLFFRLAGSVVTAPPLRDRRQDIPVLVESFLRRFSAQSERRIRGLSVKAMQGLLAYSWPGNIRELEHEIRRLVYLCPNGKTIESSMFETRILRALQAADFHTTGLPGEGWSGQPTQLAETESSKISALPTLKLELLEKQAIDTAMQVTHHKLGKAAEMLGVTRFALRRRLRRLEK